MATPPESSDFPPPMSPSGMAQADDAGDSEVPRKRSKNCYDVSFDDGWDLNDDGRPKTRRVNPQRLAVRLGQELVAEMEALIVPGAKMPNFTVRKDFQERYNVDRRHIYDYFHSRGMFFVLTTGYLLTKYRSTRGKRRQTYQSHPWTCNEGSSTGSSPSSTVTDIGKQGSES